MVHELRRSGQQFQRLHVLRAHHSEVAVVERRQLRLAQALHDREHCGIDEADAQVGVGVEQLRDALVITSATSEV